MRKITVVLAVTALAVCATTAVCADAINLSENWYMRITNFSLHGGGEEPFPLSIDLTGFAAPGSFSWSSTSLVEPKLQNQVPGNPDLYGTLLFDFHAGSVNTTDEALFYPFATLGSVWNATMSFDWQVYCSDPRVIFGVSSGEQTWWTAPGGSTNRSGSASFYVSTWGPGADPPAFVVSFVPEPASLVALLVPISLSGIAFRRSKR